MSLIWYKMPDYVFCWIYLYLISIECWVGNGAEFRPFNKIGMCGGLVLVFTGNYCKIYFIYIGHVSPEKLGAGERLDPQRLSPDFCRDELN